MVTSPSIYFHYLTEPFYFPKRTETKQYLFSIFKIHSKRIETVNYIFCTDNYLLALNKDYLKHDYFTDIITFQLSADASPILSDVFISMDRAKENAKQFNVSAYHEILRLVIHGTLHLCGFTDKKKKETIEMKELESYYLSEFVSREIK